MDQRLRKLQLCSFAASNENCTGVSWAWLHVKVRLHVALVRVQLNAHRVSAEVTCLDAVLFSRRKGRDTTQTEIHLVGSRSSFAPTRFFPSHHAHSVYRHSSVPGGTWGNLVASVASRIIHTIRFCS